MEILNISDAEWEVLRVVWTLDTATSREVGGILKESQNWESATTKTLLGRLVKKGFLKTEKDGNAFIYSATLTEREGVTARAHATFESICTHEIGHVLTSLIEAYDLSHKDKEELLEVLNKKESVETLACNCLNNCTCDPLNCTCGKAH